MFKFEEGFFCFLLDFIYLDLNINVSYTGFSNILNMEKNTDFTTIQLIQIKGVISAIKQGFNNANSKEQLNKTRALASNTSWVTDKTAMINGVKMFRVATDELVAAVDIK